MYCEHYTYICVIVYRILLWTIHFYGLKKKKKIRENCCFSCIYSNLCTSVQHAEVKGTQKCVQWFLFIWFFNKMYVNNSIWMEEKTTLSSSLPLHKLFAMSQLAISLTLYIHIMIFMFSSLPKNESAKEVHNTQYTRRKCKFCMKDCAKIRLDFHQLITSSASQAKFLFVVVVVASYVYVIHTYCV